MGEAPDNSNPPGMINRASRVLSRGTFLLGGAVCAGVLSVPTAVRAARALRLVLFPGGMNWTTFIARDKGFFAREGLDVAITPTPNSVQLFSKLMAGEYDVASTALDNVVAYDEGQGDRAVTNGPFDLFAFMAHDQGLLNLVVAPEVKSYADLRGKTLAVDAIATGYAFVLRALLERNGLRSADYTLVAAGGTKARYEAMLAGAYAGSILGTPFELQAQDRGLRVLERVGDVFGAYQGSCGVARRAWAAAHPDLLVAYIRAMRASARWLFDPANGVEARGILASGANLTPALADAAATRLLDSRGGLSPNGAFSHEGIATVLELRNKYGGAASPLVRADSYIDTTYYARAEKSSPASVTKL